MLMPSAPYPYHDRFEPVAQGTVHYIDEGAGAAMLIPCPAPVSIVLLRRLIDGLTPHFRVVAFEFPGLAGSTASDASEATLDHFAATMVELVDRLALENVTLIVSDTAGCVGLNAASRSPERYAGFVVLPTVAFPLTRQFALVRFVLRHVVGSPLVEWLNRKLNIFPTIVPALSAIRHRPSAADRAYQRAQFTPGERDNVIGFLRRIGIEREFLRRTAEGIRTRLADKPALLVFGRFDPMRLFGAPARFRKLFRRTDYVVIAGENHFPQIAEGERAAAMITRWHGRVAQS